MCGIRALGTHALHRCKVPGERGRAGEANRTVLVLRYDQLFAGLDAELGGDANGGAADLPPLAIPDVGS